MGGCLVSRQRSRINRTLAAAQPHPKGGKMEEHDCTNQVEWDEKPDYEGTIGLCMRWLGECKECGRRVYYLWEPKGIRDSNTNESL